MSTNGSTVFEEQSRHVLRNNARRCLRRTTTTMVRITSDVNWTAMSRTRPGRANKVLGAGVQTSYVHSSISTYNAHTEPLLENLRILKIQDILLLQTLKMYHNHRNNKLPTYLQNWSLHANKEIHHHNTRQADELHTHRVLHKFAEKCLRYNLIRVINNSPFCILNKLWHSLTGFANYAKPIFIKKYQDICTIQHCYTCLSINTRYTFLNTTKYGHKYIHIRILTCINT